MRAWREAEAVAGLRHCNIVQVHDVGDFEGLPYFTMEFVEGGSLAQKLGGVPQPGRDAADMVAKLSEAVHVAHQGGIVHRDLKPSNVLLTADGTPKITDFGLAGRTAGEAARATPTTNAPPASRHARIGTPSYMAPEQALGTPEAFGPSVDVYALGALLYEMLTGRPPFRAETASETRRQLVAHEPVPPSRLNSKVPRDLETICLKCLRKDPGRRYPTSDALHRDLVRFLRGEPIEARPVGWPERAAKWARRRPAVAAALALAALLAVALVAGSLKLAADQAQRRQAIEADLKEAADLQRRSLWAEARAALASADANVGGGGAENLRGRLAQARRDLDLVVRLDTIHLYRLASGELRFYKARADREYAAAFAEAGLGNVGEDPAGAAARVRASAISVPLVAAIDDWAVCASGLPERRWLMHVASQADPDPTGWRQRLRDADAWDDRQALATLAQDAPLANQPVSLLLAVGEQLRAAGGDAPAFLRRVQAEHPADFWANLVLGDALVATDPVEAAGYYRAALASRPGAAVGYTSLGDALNGQRLTDAAIAYHRRAVQVDPRYPRGHTNLGNLLGGTGHLDEALACYRTALELDPNYAWAHFDLANALRAAGRNEEALEHFRRFNALEPANTHVANILRSDLVSRGKGEEVLRAWKAELASDPPDHAAWFGYAELCLFLGREDEYRRARRDLLRRFGDTTDPFVAERVCRAMLLSPPDDDELRAAAALADRAVAAKATTPQWIYPYFLFAQGLAKYRLGHYENAVAIMSGEAASVMGPAPRLVTAMAEHRAGHADVALKALAEQSAGFDWRLSQVGSRDHWIWHVLRREAEAMILPNLPAFLDGRYEPRGNDERLALLGVCRSRDLTRTSARLYADAFAADPRLAEDVASGLRYKAACAAAAAGCGRGADAASLDAAERTRWRAQALAWLRADLAVPRGGTEMKGVLARWQTDAELSGVRDRNALTTLPADEREQWTSFWAKVSAAVQSEATAGASASR